MVNFNQKFTILIVTLHFGQRLGIGAVLNCAPSVCADPKEKYKKVTGCGQGQG